VWTIAAMLLLAPWAAASVAAAESRVADAVQRRDRAAIAELLKQRVDVNAPQPDGATALAWAAHWNDLEIAERLLAAGANVNLANELGVTPLMLAAVNGSGAMVERLLKAGAQSKAARPSGETALMLAARAGSAASVKLLVATGADPNVKTKTGDTALMFAAAERHPAAEHALIEAGADVNARAQVGGRLAPATRTRRARCSGAPTGRGRRPAEGVLRTLLRCAAPKEGTASRRARGRVHAAPACRDVRRSRTGEDPPASGADINQTLATA
jgi:ankyrin repeat protein